MTWKIFGKQSVRTKIQVGTIVYEYQYRYGIMLAVCCTGLLCAEIGIPEERVLLRYLDLLIKARLIAQLATSYHPD
jgi:hypothetical protein